MEKKLTWVEVLLLVACFLGAFAVISIAFSHFVHKADKEVIGDAATWFGAIGTVGGIFVATSLAYWTWHKGQVDKANDKEVVAQAVLAIIYRYRYLLEKQLRKVRRPIRASALWIGRTDVQYFATELNALDKVPLHQQPTYLHVHFLMQAKLNIEAAIETINFANDIFSRWDAGGRSYEFAELKLDEIKKTADHMTTEAAKLIESLGRVPHPEPDTVKMLRKFPGFDPLRWK